MATFVVESLRAREDKVQEGVIHLERIYLYTNDVTPTRTFDGSEFVEPTTTGYAPVDASAGGWTGPFEDANDTAYMDHAAFIFDCTADSAEQYVYGWFMKNGSGQLLYSQRGDGAGFPFPFWRLGDRVVVKVRLTQESYAPLPTPAPSL